MLTPAQLRAARALLGIDHGTLAVRSGVSLPTIQRMEASDGYVRGVVDTLIKVVAALERDGVELINEDCVSPVGGRGVRCGIRRAREPGCRLRASGPQDFRPEAFFIPLQLKRQCPTAVRPHISIAPSC